LHCSNHSFGLPALCALAITLAGQGPLRADSLAFLHNGSSEPIVIHRVPSSASQVEPGAKGEVKWEGRVLGWLAQRPTRAWFLEPTFHPTEAEVVTLAPGATAGLAWIDRTRPSSRTHLRVVLGGDGSRRCFLTYRVEGRGVLEQGFLEPYGSFGPAVRLGETLLEDRVIPSFLGVAAQAAAEGAGPEAKDDRGAAAFTPDPPMEAGLDADVLIRDFRVDPERVEAPGSLFHLNSPTAARHKGAKLLDWAPRHPVAIANRSGRHLYLTLLASKDGNAGPGVLLGTARDLDPERWLELEPHGRPSRQSYDLIPAGSSGFLGLAEPCPEGRETLLTLKMDGDERTCLLRYQVLPGGDAVLQPHRSIDRALLGDSGEGGEVLTVEPFPLDGLGCGAGQPAAAATGATLQDTGACPPWIATPVRTLRGRGEEQKTAVGSQRQEPGYVKIRVPDLHQGRHGRLLAQPAVTGTEPESLRWCPDSLKSSPSRLFAVENWLQSTRFALRLKP